MILEHACHKCECSHEHDFWHLPVLHMKLEKKKATDCEMNIQKCTTFENTHFSLPQNKVVSCSMRLNLITPICKKNCKVEAGGGSGKTNTTILMCTRHCSAERVK